MGENAGSVGSRSSRIARSPVLRGEQLCGSRFICLRRLSTHPSQVHEKRDQRHEESEKGIMPGGIPRDQPNEDGDPKIERDDDCEKHCIKSASHDPLIS